MSFKLSAFWPYDLFPFALTAQVTKLEDESVTVEGFGRLRRSERMVFAPANVGKKLDEELKRLKAERNERLAEIEKEFGAKLAEAFKKAGVSRPGR